MAGPQVAEIFRLARLIQEKSGKGSPKSETNFRDLGFAEVMRLVDSQLVENPLARLKKRIKLRKYLFDSSVVPYLNTFPQLATPGQREGVKEIPAILLGQNGDRFLLYTKDGWQVAQLLDTKPITYALGPAMKYLDTLYTVFGIQPDILYKKFIAEVDFILMRVQKAALEHQANR